MGYYYNRLITGMSIPCPRSKSRPQFAFFKKSSYICTRERDRGRRSPIFFYKTMNKEQIIQAIGPAVAERGCFLVEVTVSAANDIEIVIEKEEGIVDWEDCAALDKVVHEAFDQDVEDYALTVSSAGLDRPFKVLRQYQKAIGTQVDVKFRGGKRIIATLTSADENSIGLKYTALEAVEGKKKKEKVEHEDICPLSEINSVTPYIEFK